MEHQKKLLNEASDSKFLTRKQNIANNQSNKNYDVGNATICNTGALKSIICDYNDDYNLVNGNIMIAGNIAAKVAFKNCALFTKYITKIDGATIDDIEDLDLFLLMNNVLEYSPNYSEITSGSLWIYSNDGATDVNTNIANNANFKSFQYKTILIES